MCKKTSDLAEDGFPKLNKILSLTTIWVEGGKKVSCVGQQNRPLARVPVFNLHLIAFNAITAGRAAHFLYLDFRQASGAQESERPPCHWLAITHHSPDTDGRENKN